MTESLSIDNTTDSENSIKSPRSWGEIIFGVAKKMEIAERLTAAIYMIYLCDPPIQQVTVTPKKELSETVKQAIAIAERKTAGTKLEVAIQLLDTLLLDEPREENDRLPDPGDYEGEEYYSSDRPILGECNSDLDEEMEAIAEANSNILQQIAMLIHGYNWHEKMALATNAIVAIDDSHTQLCAVQPKHGRYNENLAAAIGLLRHLSPGAKAELAVDILSSDWELGATENASSTLIE